MVTMCEAPGCDKPVRTRGMCHAHYMRVTRHGSTEHKRPTLGLSLVERLEANSDRSGECWLWTGYTRTGYGMVGTGDRRTGYAHRVLWELQNGPVPEGLELDHLCGVRSCIRPDHLEAVTHAENMRRMRERRASA